jgi:pimeloyl-ACP methyl ester carboxylesterase/DNA-binding winged helix-turn-helix (wHTH) protein
MAQLHGYTAVPYTASGPIAVSSQPDSLHRLELAPTISFAPFRDSALSVTHTLDLTNQCLWRAQQRIPLTPKAYSVLRYLIKAAGRLVTKEELLDHVWNETFVGDAVLKVCISEIRRALEDVCKAPRFIETLHRRGYRFVGKLDQPHIGVPNDAGMNLRSKLARPGLDTRPLESRDENLVPETRYARSGDVNIAYQILGNGPIDLIFVMGWVSHLEYFWTEPSFARFLRRLASFSRVILLDKRGTGLSDCVPLSDLPTLEQRMDDVRAVMDAVGCERAAICGVSEGGIMSALFAATYPTKTLALITIGTYAKRLRDSSYPWGPTTSEREEFYQEILQNWGGPIGLEERAPSVAADPKFREWWATYLRMGASPGAALALTRMNTEIDARPILAKVRVPSLILHRTGDRCISIEEGRYVASLVSGSKFVELAGTDHLPFVGDQDSILDEVEEFLIGTRHSVEAGRVLMTVLRSRLIYPRQVASRTHSKSLTAAHQRFFADSRRHIEWFRGRQVYVDDHNLIATFDGPTPAIRAACVLAGQACHLGLIVSQGLHTGECEGSETMPSGMAVDVAHQLADEAIPGEVLVSSTVRELVAGSGFEMTERGTLNTQQMPGALRAFRVNGRHPSCDAH